MDKYFVCLAVSYKHGGRCIGGVELNKKEEKQTYEIVKDHKGTPKWIRPVTRCSESGAIPTYLSSTCKVMDIIRITDVEACPDCAQSENYYFSSIERAGHIKPSAEILNLMCDNKHSLLFENRGKAVHPDIYATMRYSLMLIKADNVSFFMENRYGTERKRLRARFIYKGFLYDLPVTDPALCEKANNGVVELNGKTTYYMTISLGVEHEGWHSKLIANAIPVGG